MNELVSIIVPVYNVEMYLTKCIESILKQSYKNIEVILVDDGSRDKSSALCDAFALRDSRIRVIHKENGGLSDARNAGMDLCSGSYIIFIDSDDYIDTNTIEELYKEIKNNNADIAICGHIASTEKKTSIKYDGEVIVGTGQEILGLLLKDFTWSAWGKLIKRKIINSQQFAVGMLYEDFEYVPKLLLHAKKAVFLKKPLYHYLIRDNGIMGNSKNNYSEDYMIIAEKNINLFKSSIPNGEDREQLLCYLYIRIFADVHKQYKASWRIKNIEFERNLDKTLDRHLKEIISNDYLPIKYKLSYFSLKYLKGVFGFVLYIKYKYDTFRSKN